MMPLFSASYKKKKKGLHPWSHNLSLLVSECYTKLEDNQWPYSLTTRTKILIFAREHVTHILYQCYLETRIPHYEDVSNLVLWSWNPIITSSFPSTNCAGLSSFMNLKKKLTSW